MYRFLEWTEFCRVLWTYPWRTESADQESGVVARKKVVGGMQKWVPCSLSTTGPARGPVSPPSARVLTAGQRRRGQRRSHRIGTQTLLSPRAFRPRRPPSWTHTKTRGPCVARCTAEHHPLKRVTVALAQRLAGIEQRRGVQWDTEGK